MGMWVRLCAGVLDESEQYHLLVPEVDKLLVDQMRLLGLGTALTVEMTQRKGRPGVRNGW